MVGAIDVATHEIETPQEVAATLRNALKYVDANKLIPCTNCGMAPLPRRVANAKLEALVAGTEIVRKELTGGLNTEAYANQRRTTDNESLSIT